MATTGDARVFLTNLMGTWDQIERQATVLVNGITFQLYGWIVAGTRVDTGRMRAGWAISLYAADSYVPGVGTHSLPSAQQFVAELGNAPLNASRIIYNNVEYVAWWEYGTEARDGDHMVQIAVQRLLTGGGGAPMEAVA